MAERVCRIRVAEDALQPLEAMERERRLCTNALGTGRSGRRNGYADDRCEQANVMQMPESLPVRLRVDRCGQVLVINPDPRFPAIGGGVLVRLFLNSLFSRRS